MEKIREMSKSIRLAVNTGELSASRGAEIANQIRNQIMDMQRARDFDLGRSLAKRMKSKGISLEESIARAMKKLKLEGKPFNQLSGQQQRQVLMEVIGTAENPWWQTGRETANIAGGLGGGFAGGAAMGAAGGIWAGPVGVDVGIVVGGILGAVLADHAYVEAAGTSDPTTRRFIDRFRAPEKNNSTSFLSVGPPPTFHPPEHISICAGGCALVADPHSAPYCGIIYFRDPYRFLDRRR